MRGSEHRLGMCAIVVIAGAATAGYVALPARGAPINWTGAIDTNFSNGGNWVGGNVPSQYNPATGAETDVAFKGKQE